MPPEDTTIIFTQPCALGALQLVHLLPQFPALYWITGIGGGQAVCGVRGGDNGFYVTLYSGAWLSFVRVPGVINANPSCARIGNLGQAICAVRGTDNGFYATTYSGGWPNWSSFVKVEGAIVSDPGCTSLTATSGVLCGAVGLNNNALFRTIGP